MIKLSVNVANACSLDAELGLPSRRNHSYVSIASHAFHWDTQVLSLWSQGLCI